MYTPQKGYINGRKKYRDLEKTYDFDEILRITCDYEKYATMNSKKYNTKVIYRIKSLIFLGKFDEAISLCNEALSSKLLRPENVELVKYYLYTIYLYKKEFIKCFSYIGQLDDINERLTRAEKYTRLFESIIYEENPDLYNRGCLIGKENFVTHVTRRRGELFNIDIDIITDAIMNNFDKARIYYINSTEVRVFRCFNVGRTDYHGKNETCSYIIVHSKNDCPETLITAYLVSSANNLEFCDITSEVYNASELRKGNAGKQESATLNKFRVRQAKKKN